MHSVSFLQTEIEKEIAALHLNGQPENLYQPMEYILGLGGKRMRPVLVLLGCELFGGDYKKAMQAALGIELFHNFTLLHDDIMDQAPLRRGKETVHHKWNTHIAILSGDALFVKSCALMMEVDDKILRSVQTLFHKTAIEVCEGQQLDMDFENLLEVTPEDYIGMISLKTSVLLACSLQTGAMIAGASKADAEKVYEFGKNIGIAFQIQDDLLDALGDRNKFGKKTGGDIEIGKKTFLFSEACKLLSGRERHDFIGLYNSKNDSSSKNKIADVISVFEKLDLKKQTQTIVDSYFNKAINSLQNIKVLPENAEELKNFCEQLLVREI